MTKYSYIINEIAKKLGFSNDSENITDCEKIIKQKVSNKDFIKLHNINYTLHHKYSANNLQEVYNLYKI